MFLFLLHLKHRANGGIKRLQSAQKILAYLRNNKIPADLDEWIIQSTDESLWEIRNIAVKAVGLARRKEFINWLCDVAGNTAEKGFLRRNVYFSLKQLEVYTAETRDCAVASLDDPYWEVRTQAADYISRQGEPDSEIESILINRIFKKNTLARKRLPLFFTSRGFKEKNFESRSAFTRALGTTATDMKSLEATRLLMTDPNWMVRNSAIASYCKIGQHLKIDPGRILNTIKDIDLTSPDFRPVFPIRVTFNEMINKYDPKRMKSGN